MDSDDFRCPLFFQMENFYKSEFGWICKNCERKSKNESTENRSRLMNEGEAESKTPTFTTSALAKWTDETRQTLTCPNCKTTESV
jgi:protein-arginine kinase activator protein McsA